MSDVSVIVPSYNHALFVEETLRSIFFQTLKPKKLIVIDDGSKDDSVEIISRVLADCPFDCELIARENRGLCATLNQGVSLSEEKYFAYLGSDDLWFPDFLAQRTKLLELRPNAVLGYGNVYFIDDKGEIFDSSENHRDSWANYSDGDARMMLLSGLSPISSTVVYRRSNLDNILWNPDSRLEDYEMYVRLVSIGEFAFDPKTLSAWRHHGYNTSNDMEMMLDEVIDVQKRYFNVLGVSQAELLNVHARTKFRYGRIMLQKGNKKEAFRLLWDNWYQGGSMLETGKTVVQLLLPASLNRAYQRGKQKRNKRRYLKPGL
ncbi:MAG: glycosyltransferase family A protein [Blastocatellia bacterium]